MINELNNKQALFIAALLSEPTLAAAARRAGCHERTGRRWLSEPAFRTALREARTHALDAALARLAGSASAAVHTLDAVLSDPTLPAAVRVAAARHVLTAAMEASGSQDLTARVEELERLLCELTEPSHLTAELRVA